MCKMGFSRTLMMVAVGVLAFAVILTTDAAGTTNIVIDSAGLVGIYDSLALDGSGSPVISYYDQTNGDLKLAVCGDPACTTKTLHVVDSAGWVGHFSSIVLDGNDNPVISYYDGSNWNLKLAICGDPICTTSTLRTVDNTGWVGYYSSVVLDGSRKPIISYYANENHDLKLGACDDAACSTVTLRTLDSVGDVGLYTSMALNGSGNPVISYFDATNDDLKLAVCDDATCSTSTLVVVDEVGDVGYFTSLALDGSGNPVISYYDNSNRELKLAVCDDPLCSTKSIWVVVRTTVKQSSLALDGLGNIVISYADQTWTGSAWDWDLALAVCGNGACPAAAIRMLDEDAKVGQYSSLELDGKGNAYVSHFDEANHDLKLAISWLGMLVTPSLNPATPSAPDVAEAGSRSFTVTLLAEPTAAVTIPVSISDAEQCMVNAASVSLDSTNWNTGVTVTVSGLPENIVDGDRPCILITGDPVSADSRFDSMTAADSPDVNFLIINDDIPAVISVTSTVIASVDTGGDVGSYNSLALDGSGNPIISYHDATNSNLKMAVCNDAICTAPTLKVMDSAGTVGEYTSLALDVSGNPVTSYYDRTNGNLKLAVCDDAACTTSMLYMVDGGGDVGWDTSLALDSSDHPVISYRRWWANELKLVVCNDPACSTKIIRIIDAGWESSVVLDANGYPVIAYFDDANNDLKLVSCGDTTCLTTTITTVDSGGEVGRYVSLVLNGDGNPVISYYDMTNRDLKLAVCTDRACTTRSFTTIDRTPDDVGLYTSLALDGSGNPVVSYYDATNKDVKLAFCGDPTCGMRTITTVDSTGNVGLYSSLVLDGDGKAVISYYDANNQDLKLAIVSTAGIVIAPDTNPTTPSFPDVLESGSRAFTFRLSSSPAADVIIPVSVGDAAQCMVDVSSVTLNSANWSTGVIVTMSGIDNSTIDGDRSCDLVTGDPASTDANYDSFTAADSPDLNITIFDDEAVISGVVYRTDGTTPIPNIRVHASGGDWSDSACTDSGGNYMIRAVPANTAVMVYVDGANADCSGSYTQYQTEYWQEALDSGSATPITLTNVTPVATGIDFTLSVAPNVNLLLNGDFSEGQTSWNFWGDIDASVSGGQLNFNRTSPGWKLATAYQTMNVAFPADTPLQIVAQIGNTSNVSKGVEIILRDAGWDEAITCMVTVPPNTANQQVAINAKTSVAWSSAIMAFRAYDPDGVGSITVDNVSVKYIPTMSWLQQMTCSGYDAIANAELVSNGNYSSGLKYWVMWGDYVFSINNGVLEFYRTNGATRAAVLAQDVTQHLPKYAKVGLSVDLGNSSASPKDVEIIFRDFTWSQRMRCQFTIPANQPLTTVTLRGTTIREWGRPVLVVRALDADGLPAVLVDNVSLIYDPNLTTIPNCDGSALSGGALSLASTTPVPSGLIRVEAGDSLVAKIGDWTTAQSNSASGGAYLYSSGAIDDGLNLTFEGTQVHVTYVQHPALGSFVIEVDGIAMTTVNSGGEEAFDQFASVTNLTDEIHTVGVYALDGTVAIDAFDVEGLPLIAASTESAPESAPSAEPVLVPPPIAQPYTLPFFDNMESGSGNWLAAGGWNLSASGMNGSSGWAATGQSSILTLARPVDLGSAITPQLSFQTAIQGNGAVIEISRNGQNWSVLTLVMSNSAWNNITVDLSAYLGETIWLRWHWISTGGASYWLVDDVLIADMPVMASPPIAPAPVQDSVTPDPSDTPEPGYTLSDLQAALACVTHSGAAQSLNSHLDDLPQFLELLTTHTTNDNIDAACSQAIREIAEALIE